MTTRTSICHCGLVDDVYASMHFYGRASDHHAPIWFLIVIVGASLIDVGPTAVLLAAYVGIGALVDHG